MSTIEDKVRQIVVSTLKDELHDWRVEHGDARLENLRKRVEKLEQRVRFVLPETQAEAALVATTLQAILLKQGDLCPKCFQGTRATSKRWARCRECGERVERKTLDAKGGG